MIQYNVVILCFYSCLYIVCGIKGFVQKYFVFSIVFEFDVGFFFEGKVFEEIMECYKYFFIVIFGIEVYCRNLFNEMNYVMDCWLIYCLCNGLLLDMDVYDVVEWLCIIELSE